MRRLILLLAAILAARMNGAPVITEVCTDPPGGSTEVPGDASHEYVEIFNPGPNAVNLCAYYLLAGSATSIARPESCAIQVWQGDTLVDVGQGTPLKYDSLLPPGAYAMIFGRKYASAPETNWIPLPAGTFVFALHRTGFKSGGLSGSAAQVSLNEPGGEEVSTFNLFGSDRMVSGETKTWQRVHPDSSDALQNWLAATPTPGAAIMAAETRINDAVPLEFRAVNRRLVPGCDSLAFINLAISAAADALITVRAYDLSGRPVKDLCREAEARTVRFLQWDGRSSGGGACPPGIYVLRCESRGEKIHEARKIAVVIGGRCRG